MNLALAGRTVVISGAASGIGRATALAFADEGARVALLDRDAAALAAVHSELLVAGASAEPFVCDVTDEHAVSAAVAGAAAAFGGIDHVVSCAGISGPFGAALGDISLAEWNAVFSVNVTGAFLLVRAALSWLQATDAATIVFLASDSAVVAAPGMVPYCASKGALVQLATWSIGTLGTDADGKATRTWDDTKNAVFALPGNDGKPAPVFAGGSNIGISAKSKNPELAKTLLKIIYSEDYQNMLGENGLGPANSDYVNSLGDDQFAQALIESASNSKLTPAAPGWATVEGSLIMEEFFSKIKDATDLKALATEYDEKLTPMLNGK